MGGEVRGDAKSPMLAILATLIQRSFIKSYQDVVVYDISDEGDRYNLP